MYVVPCHTWRCIYCCCCQAEYQGPRASLSSSHVKPLFFHSKQTVLWRSLGLVCFQENLCFVGDLPSVIVTLWDLCEDGKILETEKRYELMRFYFLVEHLLEQKQLRNKVGFVYIKGNVNYLYLGKCLIIHIISYTFSQYILKEGGIGPYIRNLCSA